VIRVELDDKEARAALDRLDAGCRAVGAIRLAATNDRAYAYGIETGRHAGGRLARRAGGARMYERGLADAGPQLEAMVADGVPYGAGGVNAATARWGRSVAEPSIRKYTPVRSGALRGAVRVREG
jgi:hypothetical protein